MVFIRARRLNIRLALTILPLADVSDLYVGIQSFRLNASLLYNMALDVIRFYLLLKASLASDIPSDNFYPGKIKRPKTFKLINLHHFSPISQTLAP